MPRIKCGAAHCLSAQKFESQDPTHHLSLPPGHGSGTAEAAAHHTDSCSGWTQGRPFGVVEKPASTLVLRQSLAFTPASLSPAPRVTTGLDPGRLCSWLSVQWVGAARFPRESILPHGESHLAWISCPRFHLTPIPPAAESTPVQHQILLQPHTVQPLHLPDGGAHPAGLRL